MTFSLTLFISWWTFVVVLLSLLIDALHVRPFHLDLLFLVSLFFYFHIQTQLLRRANLTMSFFSLLSLVFGSSR